MDPSDVQGDGLAGVAGSRPDSVSTCHLTPAEVPWGGDGDSRAGPECSQGPGSDEKAGHPQPPCPQLLRRASSSSNASGWACPRPRGHCDGYVCGALSHCGLSHGSPRTARAGLLSLGQHGLGVHRTIQSTANVRSAPATAVPGHSAREHVTWERPASQGSTP